MTVKKRILHRLSAVLPGILLLLLMAACAEQTQTPQLSQNTEQTSVSSQAETSSKVATSTSVEPIQPIVSEPSQPTQEDPIPDGYVVVETEEVNPFTFYSLRWALSTETDICHAVARRSSDTGRLTVCLIEGGFQKWHLGEDGCTVTLLRRDSTWTPPTFPERLELKFHEAGVSCQEAVYFAPLAEDSWYIYSDGTDATRPDPNLIPYHEAVQLTNLFDGVGILLQRPDGVIGAGDDSVRSGVTVHYDEAAHTMTVHIAYTTGKLAADSAKNLHNGYVERVEIVETGDSVELILHLTSEAVGYTLSETECITERGDEPAMLISIRFSQTAESLL